MEIKNFLKKHIKPLIYIFSCIILGILFYYYIATSVLSIPIILTMGLYNIESIIASILYPFSLLILFFAAAYILYKYSMTIILDFSNKKLLRPIILLIILVILISICVIFNFVLSSSLKHLFLLIIYIFGTILIPIILLGIILLNDKNSKKDKIKKSVLIIFLAIIIYVINVPTLLVGATYINTYIENNLVSKNTQIPNLEYLANYAQKMTTKGFVYKSDVEYIINIANLRNEKVIVNYKFDDQTISISNKDENFKNTISENLKWEYYKFEYTYENNVVTINIEKYASIQENEEKNADIILTGSKRNDLIQNITSNNVSPDSTNFVLENDYTKKSGYKYNISDLRLLLVYDDTFNNFIPVVNNENSINMIESYKVTSTNVEITLNNDVTLNVPDYTIRINRYNDDLTVSKSQPYSYYYYYEPGVTTYYDKDGKTILNFEFNNVLSLDKINNIEIIFGNN